MTHASKPQRRALQGTRFSATTVKRAGASWQQHGLVQMVPDLVLLFALFVEFIFLFNLWWSVPVALRPSGALGQFLDLLRAQGLMPLIGLLGLMPTSLVALRRLRWRINHTRFLWKSTCPRCGGDDLQRSPRKPVERRIANMGIPVRRYICVDCHWRGPRIESTLVHD